MQRRDFVRHGAAALGAMAIGVQSGAASASAAGYTPVSRLPPVRASMDRVTKITVCTRPFRAQGPRLDVERIGHKTVVHNYGHGGSGWSLSWGSASVAAARAMSTGIRDWAVIGCGAPVDWYDNYELTDIPYQRFAAEQAAANTIPFAELQGEMIPEIGPEPTDLAPGSHAFPVPYVRRATSRMFNLIAYQRLLLSDFHDAGGMVERREFQAPQDFARLPQKCIINCTGYGARALFSDESVIPVRGQLTRLIPQPEVSYGLAYRNVFVVPSRDGIVLQYYGADEAQGYNDASTEPELQEAELAVDTIAQLNEMTPAPV